MLGYLVNGLIYYFGWFLCVYLGGIGYSITSALISSFLTCGQLSMTFYQNRPLFYQDLRLAILALFLGVFMEMGFIQCGFLLYTGGNHLFPPLWLTSLYPLFAVTLNHSLVWIQKWKWLPFILGGIGAPLSYRAGEALHAVVIPDPYLLSLTEIGVIWGLYLTLILYVNTHFLKKIY
ncbi:MAG: DUF2878 domain-containing protein [Simkaniaceae bacterium]|nr:DUF2878 domain-containing protein [Simkaniaceae bacterium]